MNFVRNFYTVELKVNYYYQRNLTLMIWYKYALLIPIFSETCEFCNK